MSLNNYEVLASIEWDYESWQYNQTQMYKRKTDGALFHASDSGCSCPLPFEYVTEADLVPIRSTRDFNQMVRLGIPQQAQEDVAEARKIVTEALAEWNKF